MKSILSCQHVFHFYPWFFPLFFPMSFQKGAALWAAPCIYLTCAIENTVSCKSLEKLILFFSATVFTFITDLYFQIDLLAVHRHIDIQPAEPSPRFSGGISGFFIVNCPIFPDGIPSRLATVLSKVLHCIMFSWNNHRNLQDQQHSDQHHRAMNALFTTEDWRVATGTKFIEK